MPSDDAAARLPGVKHKVVGLVSGGKDSCFNMMHTVANGHELVALATLTPEPGVDEIDSHMYQSVGTTIPPLIAEAMGLPHYSRVIRGGAVEQGAEYGSRERGGEGSGKEGDETEDLTALLTDIMAKHPDVTAVSSGAILSNYQRLRIEHVCQRLGLTSLAYLWQSEQLPLVSRMVGSGLEAVLVKVAGIGLGQKQIGKSLGQLLPLLTRLYGAHPAGEGGEYETLTVDCPLFSGRISFVESEVVEAEPEPFPVAYLRITRAELQPKAGWVRPTVAELRALLELDTAAAGQEGLDEKGLAVLDAIGPVEVAVDDASALAEQLDGAKLSPPAPPRREVQFGRRGRWFAVSAEGCTAGGVSVGGELAAALDAIKSRLAAEGLSLPLHAAHITLLLSSMAHFPAANAAYARYFGTSPPSRAAVAVPLPLGERVRVEVVGFDDRGGAEARVGGRSALHVQGLSYWAPANIGPYSQAVTVDARLHIAGQIALRPASLTLAPHPESGSPYPAQAALALQHVGRVLDALRSPAATGGGWAGWVEACTCWWARPRECGGEGPAVARRAWAAWAAENDCSGAPAIFVQARELPRGALVEYQVNVHTGRPGCEPPATGKDVDEDSDDDSDDEDPAPVYSVTELTAAYREECAAPASRRGSRRAVFLHNDADAAQLSTLLGDDAVSAKLYHALGASGALYTLVSATLQQLDVHCVPVPVLGVQDARGRGFPVALEVFGA